MLHTIQPGDSLHNIASRYNTTVEHIVANNTYISPYNLVIGSTIVICPNHKNNTIIGISTKGVELIKEMNTLWEQHVFWTRLFLISVAEELKDLDFTKARLLRNPVDIANLYRNYYKEASSKQIENLLTDHLVIGGDLIVALKNGNTTLASSLTTKWYKNADEMSKAFSTINPFYNEKDLQDMFYMHLGLTTDEVSARLKKDYEADIAAFDKIEIEALKMAEYFSTRNHETNARYVLVESINARIPRAFTDSIIL
jgi:spore germination protein YaaH